MDDKVIKPRRLWPHTLAIVAAILLLIVVLIWLCAVRGWLGAPECCCCGHVDGVTHKTAQRAPATADVADFILTFKGDGSAGRPFRLASVGSPTGPQSIGAPTDTVLAGPTTIGMANDLEPVDITGEIGDGGDTFVDTLPPDGTPIQCEYGCGVILPPVTSDAPEPHIWALMTVGIFVAGAYYRRQVLA